MNVFIYIKYLIYIYIYMYSIQFVASALIGWCDRYQHSDSIDLECHLKITERQHSYMIAWL